MHRIAVFLPLVACVTPTGADMSQSPNFSTPSASFQTSYVHHASSVGRVTVEADLVVRPDRVCVPVLIEARDKTSDAALAVVEKKWKELSAAAQAEARIDDVQVRLDAEGEARAVVVLRGLIEAPLPEGDAFVRARRVGALSEALAPFAQPPPGRKVQDELVAGVARVALGSPEPGVKDIEQHRPKLLEDWSLRAKALAHAAAPGALELAGCTPPPQVSLVAGTLEKVGLRLPVSCAFTVKAK